MSTIYALSDLSSMTIIIIHQPIKLQRASRDSCLLANIPVYMHPSAGYFPVFEQYILYLYM